MKTSILKRTGSFSPCKEIAGWSPRSPSGDGHDAAVSFYRRNGHSTKLSFDRRGTPSPARNTNQKPLRRVRSETDLIVSVLPSPSGSRWLPPAMLLEAEENHSVGGVPEVVIMPKEDMEYSGGGKGKGRKSVWGSGDDGGESGEYGGLGSYYQEKLKADPGNPLLLRNYARFLHEVEGDLKKAEEYYARALLASPDDGDLLSLYGRLLWESHRDSDRAEAYYDRAMEASPGDCYVLGSYANFLWDADEKGEDEGKVASSPPLVEAI